MTRGLTKIIQQSYMNMHDIKSLSHEYNQRFIYEIE